MPVKTDYQPKNICIFRVSGTLRRSEFSLSQEELAEKIDSGERPRVLAILEDFLGWERGADWDDMEFLLSHSNEIAKIAIVGELRWEAEALAFAGAGFRHAPVKYFPPEQQAAARAWLEE